MAASPAAGGHPIPLYEGLVARGVYRLSKSEFNGQFYHMLDSLAQWPVVWARVRAGNPAFVKLYLLYSEHSGRLPRRSRPRHIRSACLCRTARGWWPCRWAEAAGDYCTLHTSTGSYLSNLGITALQERLDSSLFLRVYPSVLVVLNAGD